MKSDRTSNHEQAPLSAAFVKAMREVFGTDQVTVLWVEENGFKLGERDESIREADHAAA